MRKEAYLAGAYPPGTSKHKMAKKKYGPLPVAAPVQEEVAPVAKKKTTKKVAKKKSED